MKTAITILLFLCTTGMAQAQYFRGQYWITSTMPQYRLDDGFAIPGVASGHFMAGYADLGPSLFVQRTDLAGNTGLFIYFNHEIYFNNSGIIRFTSVKAENGPNGGFILVAGYEHSTPGNSGWMVIVLDINGNVTNYAAYGLSAAGNFYSNYVVTDVCPSYLPGGFFYATGYAFDANGDAMAIVLKSLMLPPIQWMRAYHIGPAGMDNLPYAITDSPGINPISQLTELVVAGRLDNTQGTNTWGFTMRVDNVTGNPISNNLLGLFCSRYGFSNSGARQHFTGIKVSLNPAIAPTAFNYVMNGRYTHHQTNQESFWLVASDLAFTPGFTAKGNIYPINDAAVTGNLIERYSTHFGVYEYYMVGSSSLVAGTFDPDMTVIKTDYNDVLTEKFIYPDGMGVFHKGVSIDQVFNNGGYAIYGQRMAGLPEHYMIKAYYNGITASACQVDPSVLPAPDLNNEIDDISFEGIDYLQPLHMEADITYNDGDRNTCFEAAVSGGSNNRVTRDKPLPDVPKEEISVMSPNPATAGASEIHISLAGGPEAVNTVQVTVTDVLGRNCYKNQVDVDAGGSFSIPANTLPAGTYLVKIQSVNGTHTRILLVK